MHAQPARKNELLGNPLRAGACDLIGHQFRKFSESIRDDSPLFRQAHSHVSKIGAAKCARRLVSFEFTGINPERCYSFEEANEGTLHGVRAVERGKHARLALLAWVGKGRLGSSALPIQREGSMAPIRHVVAAAEYLAVSVDPGLADR